MTVENGQIVGWDKLALASAGPPFGRQREGETARTREWTNGVVIIPSIALSLRLSLPTTMPLYQNREKRVLFPLWLALFKKGREALGGRFSGAGGGTHGSARGE